MGIVEFCIGVIITAVFFFIFLMFGLFVWDDNRELGLAVSLAASCICLGFCITYIMTTKGLIW